MKLPKLTRSSSQPQLPKPESPKSRPRALSQPITINFSKVTSPEATEVVKQAVKDIADLKDSARQAMEKVCAQTGMDDLKAMLSLTGSSTGAQSTTNASVPMRLPQVLAGIHASLTKLPDEIENYGRHEDDLGKALFQCAHMLEPEAKLGSVSSEITSAFRFAKNLASELPALSHEVIKLVGQRQNKDAANAVNTFMSGVTSDIDKTITMLRDRKTHEQVKAGDVGYCKALADQLDSLKPQLQARLGQFAKLAESGLPPEGLPPPRPPLAPQQASAPINAGVAKPDAAPLTDIPPPAALNVPTASSEASPPGASALPSTDTRPPTNDALLSAKNASPNAKPIEAGALPNVLQELRILGKEDALVTGTKIAPLQLKPQGLFRKSRVSTPPAKVDPENLFKRSSQLAGEVSHRLKNYAAELQRAVEAGEVARVKELGTEISAHAAELREELTRMIKFLEQPELRSLLEDESAALKLVEAFRELEGVIPDRLEQAARELAKLTPEQIAEISGGIQQGKAAVPPVCSGMMLQDGKFIFATKIAHTGSLVNAAEEQDDPLVLALVKATTPKNMPRLSSEKRSELLEKHNLDDLPVGVGFKLAAEFPAQMTMLTTRILESIANENLKHARVAARELISYATTSFTKQAVDAIEVMRKGAYLAALTPEERETVLQQRAALEKLLGELFNEDTSVGGKPPMLDFKSPKSPALKEAFDFANEIGGSEGEVPPRTDEELSAWAASLRTLSENPELFFSREIAVPVPKYIPPPPKA